MGVVLRWGDNLNGAEGNHLITFYGYADLTDSPYFTPSFLALSQLSISQFLREETMEPIGLAMASVSLVQTLFHAYKAINTTICDVKGAREDKDRLASRIEAERTITKHLFDLLFSGFTANSPESRCLYLDLDAASRTAIYNILRQFVKVVQKHALPLEGLGIPEILADSNKTHLFLPPSTPGPNIDDTSEALKAPSSIQKNSEDTLRSRLRWAFRQKARLEEFIAEFELWNRKTTQVVELHLLRYQVVSVLERKTSLYPNSEVSVHIQRLGLDDALEAQSIALQSREDTAEFATRHQEVKDFKRPWTDLRLLGRPRTDRATELGKVDGCPVLVDFKIYRGASSPEEKMKSAKRLNQLASILEYLNRLEKAIPRCLCWMDGPDEGAYMLVFQIPSDLEPRPISLLDALPDSSVSSGPPLEQRLRLAFRLAATVSRIHGVSWLHKNLRSENIIFYRKKAQAASIEQTPSESDIPEEWFLYGFEYSRPVSDSTSTQLDRNIERNVYRHPQRWGIPTGSFSPLHDIYALGVILLELGMWRRATSLLRTSDRTYPDPYKVHLALVRRATEHLGFSAGSSYREIVLRCLNLQSHSTEDGNQFLLFTQKIREQVVEELRALAYPQSNLGTYVDKDGDIDCGTFEVASFE